MKNSKSPLPRFITGALALIISAAALTACADKSSSQFEDFAVRDPQYTAESDRAAQIEYYESLIADLQNVLLNEKIDNYQTEHEYKAAISELEEQIAALNEKIAGLPSDPSAVPQATASSTPEVTESQSDQPSSESPYVYKISNGSVTITGYVGKDTDVKIPDSINGLPVTSIGESAFQGSSVKKITLPHGVTHIDWFAFNGCTALTEIIIPASVTLIDYGALDNCPRLIVICEKDSYAELYAKSRALTVVAK